MSRVLDRIRGYKEEDPWYEKRAKGFTVMPPKTIPWYIGVADYARHIRGTDRDLYYFIDFEQAFLDGHPYTYREQKFTGLPESYQIWLDKNAWPQPLLDQLVRMDDWFVLRVIAAGMGLDFDKYRDIIYTKKSVLLMD